MKKGKKIWNRLLSLVLCLVMVTGMFAGMGMEAKAAVTAYPVDMTVTAMNFADQKLNTNEVQLYVEGYHHSVGYYETINGTEYANVVKRTILYDLGNSPLPVTGTKGGSEGYRTPFLLEYEFKDVNGEYNVPSGKTTITGKTTIKLSRKNVVLTVNLKNSAGETINSGVTVTMNGQSDNEAPYVFSGLNEKDNKKYDISVNGNGYNKTVAYTVAQNGQKNRSTVIDIGSRNFNLGVNLKLNGQGNNSWGLEPKNAIVKAGNYSFSPYYKDTINLPADQYDLSVEGECFSGLEAETKTVNLTNGDQTVDLNLHFKKPVITGDDSVEYGKTINLGIGEKVDVNAWSDYWRGIHYEWSSSDPSVATVNSDGKITALKVGSTDITVACVFNDYRVTSNPKTITVEKGNPVVNVTVPDLTYGQYTEEIKLNANTAGTFLFNVDETPVNVSVPAGEDVKIPASTVIKDTPVVGPHTLSYTFTPTDTEKYNTTTDTVEYKVAARNISDALIKCDDLDNFVYDGQAKTLSNLLILLPDGAVLGKEDYTVTYAKNVDAGTAEFTITGKGNYTGTKAGTFSIQKAELSVANVNAESRQYDGTDDVKITNVSLNNLAAKDRVSDVVDFSTATAKVSSKNRGTYDKVTNLTGITLTDTLNYKFTVPGLDQEINLNQPMTISPKQVTIENVVIKDTRVYDGGTIAEITYKGTLLGVCSGEKEKVNIVKGEANYNDKNVGENKTVIFTGFELEGEEASNYSLTQPVSQTASITQKPLRMVDGSANVKDKAYDGKTSAEFSGTPVLYSADIVENDDVVIDYSSAPVFNEIGSADEEKLVTVTTNLKITGTDAANYSLQIPTVTAKITNYTAERGKDYIVNSNDWMNKDFEISAGIGCLVSEGSQDNSQWLDKLTVTCEENKSEVGTKAFYVKRENGTISRVVNDGNAEYRIDKIAPTGEVKFAPAENAWIDFINTITFDLFYKDPQEVIITANDQENLSGVASIEWYESLDNGMTLEEVQAITKWKNYDGSLIVALEDTKKFVYYVKITDNAGNVTYLSTDGAVYDITNPAITGIVNGETYYTTQVANVSDINLKEVTWNSSTIAIKPDGTVGPITLSGAVTAATTYKVAATDKAENETTVTIIMKPLAELAGAITIDNVTLNNKKELEEAKEILEDALKTENLFKLLIGEKEKIETRLTEIQKILNSVVKVEDVIKQINDLPKAKDVEIDDEDPSVENDIRAAVEVYEALSAHEKSLISASLKNKLYDAYDALTNYRILEGDGKKWVYDTHGTLTFVGNGPIRKLKAVIVDGDKVSSDDYCVSKGSTVIELKASALSGFGVGEHTFVIEYKDGKTNTVDFEIITMEEHLEALLPENNGVLTNQTPAAAATEKDNKNLITVPISGDENVIHAEVVVEGDKVTILPIDEEELEHILGEHVETGVVDVDLTQLDRKINEVDIPVETLLSIVEAAEHVHNDTEALAIHFTTGTVILDEQTMRAIIETAHGETVHLVLNNSADNSLTSEQKDAIERHDVHGMIEAYFACTTSGRRVSDFNGGKATLRIPFEIPSGYAEDGFGVWYVSDEGAMEEMETWYENGHIIWEVSHFSNFVIIYEEPETETAESEEMDVVVSTEEVETAEVGFPWWIVIIMVVVVGIAGFFVNDKKKRGKDEEA